MDDFELEIKKEFLNEALMNLEEVEGSFMELESATDQKPLLDKIFRLAHNLKGGSRAVGFGDVAEFTHQLESLVLKIQRNEILLSSEIVTTLLRSNDRLVEMLTELKGNLDATFNNADLLEELLGWLNGTRVSTPFVGKPLEEPQAEAVSDTQMATESPALSDTPVESEIPDFVIESEPPPHVPRADAFFASVPVESVSAVVSDSTSTPMTSVDEVATPDTAVREQRESAPTSSVAKESSGGGGNNGASGNKEDEIIRVSLSKIDMLNDYVGELIVLQSVVQQQSVAENHELKLQASIRLMMKLSKDIQSLSMSLRMLPVKPLVQKLQRVVRDTAKTLGKEVNFKIEGEQMDIDKSVLDRLSDPLIHILRNAVDHGLELPEDRLRQGKDPAGTVLLSFLNEGNHLVVEVLDDGKGINGEVLRKKAVEKKIISDSQTFTDKQLVNLIFHPGFSTKSETSEISGRGVGMDVVKTNVEKIGGQIDIQTTVGHGSKFKLQIPLSLAVIEGLVVTSEFNRYVIPLSQVQETINLRSQKVFSGKLGVGSCFELRGAVVPMFSLDESLGAKNSAKSDGTALIVNVEDRPIALVVHDILRAQQIVIKPFSNGIAAQKGWIGSCVLGDGQPTLIISPVDLLSGRIADGLGETTMGRVA